MVGGEDSAGLAVDASGRMFGEICSMEAKPASTQAGNKILQVGTTPAAGASVQIPTCPNKCKAGKIYRDGLRYNQNGSSTQRWICTYCGLRFSDKPLKSHESLTNSCQICAKEAKNLHVLPARKPVGTGEITEEHKALLKVFEGYLRKEGYKKNCYPSNIKTLLRLGADLKDPEDVKAVIADHNVKSGMKMQLCYSYEAFLKMNGMKWERPRGYKQDEVTPFIPEESELDQLIAAAHSRQMAAYLQTLKETFADPGEALPIEWKDISGNIIYINHPVKEHKTGGLPVSNKLIAMLNMLPHNSEQVFSYNYSRVANAFKLLKRRVAATTKNDRLHHIELRTFRHWGGTRIAELSNGNVLTVMKMLRHKSVTSSMKYIDIYKLSFRTETEYDYMAVTTPDELKVALQGGYQLVIEKFGASWFRRPKRIAIAGKPLVQREPQLSPDDESSFNKTKPAIRNAY